MPLDLTEFDKAIEPVIQFVLRSGMGLPVADERFLRKAVESALAESPTASMAAAKLAVEQSFISRAKSGQRLARFQGDKKKAEQQK